MLNQICKYTNYKYNCLCSNISFYWEINVYVINKIYLQLNDSIFSIKMDQSVRSFQSLTFISVV